MGLTEVNNIHIHSELKKNSLDLEENLANFDTFRNFRTETTFDAPLWNIGLRSYLLAFRRILFSITLENMRNDLEAYSFDTSSNTNRALRNNLEAHSTETSSNTNRAFRNDLEAYSSDTSSNTTRASIKSNLNRFYSGFGFRSGKIRSLEDFELNNFSFPSQEIKIFFLQIIRHYRYVSKCGVFYFFEEENKSDDEKLCDICLKLLTYLHSIKISDCRFKMIFGDFPHSKYFVKKPAFFPKKKNILYRKKQRFLFRNI